MARGDTVVTEPTLQNFWKYDGFSESLKNNFSAGQHPKGVVDMPDGAENRLIVIDNFTDKIYLLWGFGNVVKDSITPRPQSDEFGLDWDDTNDHMYTTSRNLGERGNWKYDGFSASLLDSLTGIAGGDNYGGCCFDTAGDGPGNYCVGENTVNWYFRCDGWTTTVTDSFYMTTSQGAAGAYGCFWDDTDTPESFNWLQQRATVADIMVMKMEGFSAVVADSLSWTYPNFGFSANPRGLAASLSSATDFESIASTTGGGDTIYGNDFDEWLLVLAAAGEDAPIEFGGTASWTWLLYRELLGLLRAEPSLVGRMAVEEQALGSLGTAVPALTGAVEPRAAVSGDLEVRPAAGGSAGPDPADN